MKLTLPACEHLVSLSNDATIFKKPQLVPVQDLKLLVRDYPVSILVYWT